MRLNGLLYVEWLQAITPVCVLRLLPSKGSKAIGKKPAQDQRLVCVLSFYHKGNLKNYLMIFSLIRLPQYWFSEDSPTPPFDDFNPQFYYTPREKDPKNKTSGDLSFDQGTCSVNSVYPPRSLGFDLSRSFNSAVYVVGWSPWPSVESIYTKQNKKKQKIKENNQKVSKTGLLFVWINFTWNKQPILL